MKEKKDTKNAVIVITSVVCILAFFVFAGVTEAITIPEIPASFLGAAAGAAITAVVTLLLLQGQTRAEEIKERNVKVFEKKSVIFSEFIEKIWEFWKDYRIEIKEFQELVDDYYKKLMLYMNEASAKIVGEQLKKIGGLTERENLSDQQKDELQTALIAIINTLSDEISLGGHIDERLFKDLGVETNAAKERERSQRTTFRMLGINKGTILTYKGDPSITCVTEDDVNKVKYDDIIRTISNVAIELNDGKSANGFDFFTYNGKTLWEMRKEKSKD